MKTEEEASGAEGRAGVLGLARPLTVLCFQRGPRQRPGGPLRLPWRAGPGVSSAARVLLVFDANDFCLV